MIEMCLELLISSVLSTNSLNNAINNNNNVTYSMENKQHYIIPDKYNLILLCDNQTQRFANVNSTDEKVFNLINSIE